MRPYGNAGDLFQYESGGLMKQKLMMATFNTRLTRAISLQGNYTLNFANDLPTTPSNPYNFARIGDARRWTGGTVST